MSAYLVFFPSSQVPPTSSWLRPLRYLMTLMEQTEKAELSLSKPSPRRHALKKPNCHYPSRLLVKTTKELNCHCSSRVLEQKLERKNYHYSSLQDDRARKLPWLSAWPLHLALISSKKSGEGREAKKGHPPNSYTKATTTDTAMPSRPMLVNFSPACVRTIRRLL